LSVWLLGRTQVKQMAVVILVLKQREIEDTRIVSNV